MPAGFLHNVPYFEDSIARRILMKEIAHGVDEDHLRFSPFQRTLDHAFVDIDLSCPDSFSLIVFLSETSVFPLPHCFKA